MSTDSNGAGIRYKSDTPPATIRQHDSGRAPVAPARERLIPKPLQRVLGFFVLLFTVGLVSCQALFN